MELKKYKYEKVPTESKFWELPTEPLYLFETHIRRSISIVPHWTTWNRKTYKKPEEIFELKIICVYQSFDAKIESYTIAVSSIEDLYHKESKDYGGPHSVIKFLIDLDTYEVKDEEGNITGTKFYGERTKEQFESDFHGCIKKIIENGSKGLRPAAIKRRVKKPTVTIAVDFETGGLNTNVNHGVRFDMGFIQEMAEVITKNDDIIVDGGLDNV